MWHIPLHPLPQGGLNKCLRTFPCSLAPLWLWWPDAGLACPRMRHVDQSNVIPDSQLEAILDQPIVLYPRLESQPRWQKVVLSTCSCWLRWWWTQSFICSFINSFTLLTSWPEWVSRDLPHGGNLVTWKGRNGKQRSLCPFSTSAYSWGCGKMGVKSGDEGLLPEAVGSVNSSGASPGEKWSFFLCGSTYSLLHWPLRFTRRENYQEVFEMCTSCLSSC